MLAVFTDRVLVENDPNICLECFEVRVCSFDRLVLLVDGFEKFQVKGSSGLCVLAMTGWSVKNTQLWVALLRRSNIIVGGDRGATNKL